MRLLLIATYFGMMAFLSSNLWADPYCISEVPGSQTCPQSGSGWINMIEGVKAPAIGVSFLADGFSGSSAKFDLAFVQAAKKWTFKRRNLSNDEVSNFYYEPRDGTADPCPGNNETRSWTFASDVCAAVFGNQVIAITRYWADFDANNNTTLSRIYDADIFFNKSIKWDVYDGPPRGLEKDFARTALHELGHALGLAHTTSATQVMYPFVTDTETTSLNTGDEDGLAALYGVIEIPFFINVAPVNYLLLD